jgi:glycosyltransferase involved in cell wall biosynthesis
VLCFLSEPTPEVRQFLDLPNARLENLPNENGDNRIQLKSVLRKTRPQILHLHFVGFLNWYAWRARAAGVKQVFFTDHHSRPAGYAPERAPAWKRTAARLVNLPLTRVICVSRYGYDCMTSLDLLPRDRFEMIYNGVDLSRVQFNPQRAAEFRRRFSIPPDRSLVTQVSWIITEKGIADFLETARLVLQQNQNVQFVLVGDGRDRAEYMKRAEAMGIADHLTWTGMVADPFNAGVFEAADVICQFSRWEEVFGWMIAEAMAHRKPVVATRVGGIPELVRDGESGFLVECGDTRAMAERVRRLLHEAELGRRFGLAGQAIVHEKFDLQANVADLIESYQLERFSQNSELADVGRLQESVS